MAILVVAAAVAGWMYGAPRPQDDAEPLATMPGWSRAAGGGWPVSFQGGDPDAVEAAQAGDDPGEVLPLDGEPQDGLPDGEGQLWDESGDAGEGATQPLDPSRPAGDFQDSGPPIVNHEVSPGETLWDIARVYGTDVSSISRSNRLRGDLIRPGQVLVVPTTKGVVHSVERGETLWDIGRLYGVSVETIAQVNRLQDPDRLSPGTLLLIPGVEGPRLERVVVAGRLQRVFSWPVRGRISSEYGWRWGRLHEGIDIAVPRGTPVRAAASGRVVFARWGGGYGYLVTVDHGSGVVTRYAHNSRLAVREGQWVRRGQIIAYSGNTGNSTGPHVHFEIRFRGRAVDPRPYLN
mgnify:CR=1 FL=1